MIKYPSCSLLIIPAWLTLTLTNVSYHQLIPFDETRYASVAWEMWHRGDFLVPHLNGATYEHKPPLLFWLYLAGWALFGVNETWLILVSPLCALAGLYATRYLAQLLWPASATPHQLAPWLLFGSLIWCVFLNSTMFDTLLTLCVLLAVTGLLKAAKEPSYANWGMYALGCGLGLLAKGPVIFIHILLPFLSGIFWHDNIRANPKSWYSAGSAAILAGIALALLWAVPAVFYGGEDYGANLIWHQTVNRVSDSFAHKRPFWWYLMLSPLLFFPWFFWPRIWTALLNRQWLNNLPSRFCLIWFAGGFLGFCFISGKQAHYLIPLYPALALLLSGVLPVSFKPVKAGDFLPYVILTLSGLTLWMLPHLSGATLYAWLLNRKLWWALLVTALGLAGIIGMILTRSSSPHLLAIVTILTVAAHIAGFFSSQGNAFHLEDAKSALEKYQNAGDPIAWVGKYDGQFQFLLRMTTPMTVLDPRQRMTWLRQQPNGHIIEVTARNRALDPQLKIDYQQHYREDQLLVLSLR